MPAVELENATQVEHMHICVFEEVRDLLLLSLLLLLLAIVLAEVEVEVLLAVASSASLLLAAKATAASKEVSKDVVKIHISKVVVLASTTLL